MRVVILHFWLAKSEVNRAAGCVHCNWRRTEVEKVLVLFCCGAVVLCCG